MKINIKKIWLSAFTMFVFSFANTALAGQGWNVSFNNTSSNGATYLGTRGMYCWYPKSLSGGFNIAASSNVSHYTEEKWAVFDGCGGDGQTLGLGFQVSSATATGRFHVVLKDTGGNPPSAGAVACSTDGIGEPTQMNWFWSDSQSHPAGQNILSCSMKDGTVTATITMPTP